MPWSGAVSPASWRTRPKAPRSSARWIAAGVVPTIGTPASARPCARLERSLATELADHSCDRSDRLLGVDDLEHVLEGERLEVEPVGGVVVGGDGLGVAVDHDRLEAGAALALAQRHRGVDAGVVELDALPDAVGPGAEDDHRRPLPRCDLGLLVVRRVVVRRGRGELGRARVHGLVDRPDAQRVADAAHHVGRHPADLADLAVGEAVTLGQAEQAGRELGCGGDLGRHLVDQGQLVDEPRVDPGRLEDLLGRGPGPDGVHHHLEAPVVRQGGPGEQVLLVELDPLAVPVERRRRGAPATAAPSAAPR